MGRRSGSNGGGILAAWTRAATTNTQRSRAKLETRDILMRRFICECQPFYLARIGFPAIFIQSHGMYKCTKFLAEFHVTKSSVPWLLIVAVPMNQFPLKESPTPPSVCSIDMSI